MHTPPLSIPHFRIPLGILQKGYYIKLNFQFLILGYLLEELVLLWVAGFFQFLILGYGRGALHTDPSEIVFQFLILGYIIQLGGWKTRLKYSFNSSF